MKLHQDNHPLLLCNGIFKKDPDLHIGDEKNDFSMTFWQKVHDIE